ncbi:uncharacterized protein LOC128245384 [Mya arenaria]|uniref:uncharacterized protein LOC128245384 n=1 Tax=Mya arenaria TaxID=6604 RepID=UPI0022E0A8AB|nr:uncharacterized protein LOC128245384 [Mya arenaria]
MSLDYLGGIVLKDGLLSKESASLGTGGNDFWSEEDVIQDYPNNYSTFINLHGVRQLLKDTLAVPGVFQKIDELNIQIQPARKRRNLYKRVAFDSIAHQGGLSGLSSAPGKPHKLAFTFENLLPYLISEMRRNHRGIETDSDYVS